MSPPPPPEFWIRLRTSRSHTCGRIQNTIQPPLKGFATNMSDPYAHTRHAISMRTRLHTPLRLCHTRWACYSEERITKHTPSQHLQRVDLGGRGGSHQIFPLYLCCRHTNNLSILSVRMGPLPFSSGLGPPDQIPNSPLPPTTRHNGRKLSFFSREDQESWGTGQGSRGGGEVSVQSGGPAQPGFEPG